MLNESANSQEQQSEGSKTQKRFEGLMIKLEAVVGGKKNLLPKKKVGRDSLHAIIQELFKKETETLAIEVEEGLRGVLKEYVTMVGDFKKEEEKLAKAKEEKTKTFCEVVERLFAKIDGIPELEKVYVEALRVGAAGAA